MTTAWDTFGFGVDNLLGAAVARRRPILGFAVDLDNNRIWARISTDSNGWWNNSNTADPATNTGGFDITTVNDGVSVVPAFSGFFGSSVVDRAILNAGASAFKMPTLPSGFSAWDTSGTTTWNPSDNSDLTLTNGNLTAAAQTTVGTWHSIRAVGSSKISGKWYFEIICDRRDAGDGWMAGIANGSASLTTYIGASNNGCGYTSGQQFYKNASPTSTAIGAFTFSSWRSCRGTDLAKNSGKWYFEANIDAVDSGDGWIIGIVNSSFTLNQQVGGDAGFNSAGYAPGPTNVLFYKQAGNLSTGLASTSAGNRVCLAVDLDNNRTWIRVNGGAWSGTSGDPVTNTGGNDVAAVNNGISVMIGWSGFNNGGLPEQGTIYTQSADFAQAIPSGFSAWDAVAGGSSQQRAVTVIN